jgi:hypothetical protein
MRITEDGEVKASQDELRELGQKLYQKIIADTAGKAELMERNDQTERVYMLDPEEAGATSEQNFDPIAMPAFRIKVNKIVGSLNSKITKFDPMAQVCPYGNSANDDQQERAIQFVALKAGFKSVLPQALLQASLKNIGIIRVGWDDRRDEFRGLKMDWFKSNEIFVYPNTVQHLDDADAVGFRYFLTMRQVDSKKATGEFFKDCDVAASYESQLTDDNTDVLIDATISIDQHDDRVKFYQCFTWEKIDGAYVLLVADLAYTSQCICSLQVADLQRIPAALVRLVRSQKRFYGDDSIGWAGKGLNLAISSLVNATIAGVWFTAAPAVFVTGLTGIGKSFSYKPGQVNMIPGGDVKVQIINAPYNADQQMGSVNYLENVMGDVIGVSKPGQGHALPSGTTATLVNELSSADNETEDTYMDAACEGVEDVFEIVREYLGVWYPELQPVYREGIAIDDPAAFLAPAMVKVTANAVSSKNETMRNLQVAGAMALDPNSQYDPQKIADLQVRLMDLPVNPESLKKDWVTGVMQMASALVQTGIDPQKALMIGGQDLVQEKQAMEQGQNLGHLDERTLGQGPDGNTTALAGAPGGAPGAGPEQLGGMPDMG